MNVGPGLIVAILQDQQVEQEQRELVGRGRPFPARLVEEREVLIPHQLPVVVDQPLAGPFDVCGSHASVGIIESVSHQAQQVAHVAAAQFHQLLYQVRALENGLYIYPLGDDLVQCLSPGRIFASVLLGNLDHRDEAVSIGKE